MNNDITLQAPAKLNLYLRILGREPDGYHRLLMVCQTISLYDTVHLERGGDTLEVRCPGIPPERNLATAAARMFWHAADIAPHGLRIDIDKWIPQQAGLGGGSADAAAVMRGLNAMHGHPLSEAALLRAGALVGSDVPFCIHGGTAIVTGRGECIEALAPIAPDCGFVVVMPERGVSTAEAFARFDELGPELDGREDISQRQKEMALRTGFASAQPADIVRGLYNDFERVILKEQTAAIKAALREWGALGALLTGSGSAVFGVFESRGAAQNAAQAMPRAYAAGPCGWQ